MYSETCQEQITGTMIPALWIRNSHPPIVTPRSAKELGRFKLSDQSWVGNAENRNAEDWKGVPLASVPVQTMCSFKSQSVFSTLASQSDLVFPQLPTGVPMFAGSPSYPKVFVLHSLSAQKRHPSSQLMAWTTPSSTSIIAVSSGKTLFWSMYIFWNDKL